MRVCACVLACVYMQEANWQIYKKFFVVFCVFIRRLFDYQHNVWLTNVLAIKYMTPIGQYKDCLKNLVLCITNNL